jgi:hypothetical protein
VLRSRSGKPIGDACSLPDAAFLHRRGDVTIAGVTSAILATTLSGLPPDLWDPLAPERAGAAAPAGGASLALALALFAVVLVAGFLVGEFARLPHRAALG